VRECGSCGSAFDERFRYCPWCGVIQRLKIVEYFPAFPLVDDNRTRGLRVSRYFSRPGHVRFSIWDAAEVRAAVSIDEEEALRLATFVRGTGPGAPRPRFTDQLKQSADALIEVLR
jgi:hypothetical protein